ncbi:DUF2484 family protein [Maritimibacter sp. HL-12]|uniref:DUF2484 family protein n=1 Tax=Maritimibacter sp. HL-12 TaxID=1162418 RepID=UPI000A0EFAF9|nr:DUF2484 family protein [Maritimibacter sp. HL-12]SMH54039.1 Protein of unknown function [Maritimibacter sp. HL-12]
MTPSLIFAALWVIAATAVAFLPIRRQIVPGALLGLAGLALIVWVGIDHGWLWALLACLAFASLFRNGIRAIPALIRGEKIEIPDE